VKHGLVIAAKDAPFPIAYDRAKQALAQCERIDECSEWANRAEAMASYYRQAKDFGLEMQARRIRLRAKRRVGELLLQLKAVGRRGPAGRPAQIGQTPRAIAARAIGMSVAQLRNVVRIARIPVDQAEAAIEATPPPSEAALLRIAPTDPKFNVNAFCGSAAYTTIVRSQHCLAMFAYWCQKNSAIELGSVLNAAEISRCQKHVAEARRWLADFTQCFQSAKT
jgi:hypothetical protein